MGDLSKDFWRYEFACKDRCGFSTVDVELIPILQDLRDFFDTGVFISSGCRCEKYNRSVGGAKRSKHKEGRAADIQVSHVTPKAVADYLDSKYPDKYGLGRYRTFTHIDTRSGKARWGNN